MSRKLLSREAAHERVLLAEKSRLLKIHLDLKHLARLGSPAHDPIDVFVPLLILMPSSLTLLIAFGLLIWIISISAVLVIQILLGPSFVAWRTERRVRKALGHAENFALLWSYGGLALTLAMHPDEYCLAPTGNWREFATHYLPDPAPDGVADGTVVDQD